MHEEVKELSYVQGIELVMRLPPFECLAQTNNHRGFDLNKDKNKQKTKSQSI